MHKRTHKHTHTHIVECTIFWTSPFLWANNVARKTKHRCRMSIVLAVVNLGVFVCVHLLIIFARDYRNTLASYVLWIRFLNNTHAAKSDTFDVIWYETIWCIEFVYAVCLYACIRHCRPMNWSNFETHSAKKKSNYASISSAEAKHEPFSE